MYKQYAIVCISAAIWSMSLSAAQTISPLSSDNQNQKEKRTWSNKKKAYSVAALLSAGEAYWQFKEWQRLLPDLDLRQDIKFGKKDAMGKTIAWRSKTVGVDQSKQELKKFDEKHPTLFRNAFLGLAATLALGATALEAVVKASLMA